MSDRAGQAERRDVLALLGFLGLALLLRVPGPLNEGLWFDEIWLLVETIRGPFIDILTTFENDNSHPLFSIFAWGSVRLFGEHAWSLRLPALVFGVASVGMMWWFARRVAPRTEALVGTLLLCVSYHHVWFSQNARGYSMLLFWTLAATYFLVRTYGGEGRRAWILYAVCLALATLTHASAALVGIAHAVVVVVALALPRDGGAARGSGPARQALLGLLLAGALSVLFHAGMLGEMVDFFSGAEAAGPASDDASEWTSIWWTIAAVVESVGVPVPLGYAALGAGVILVAWGTVVCFRRDWRHALLFTLPPAIAIAATVLMGRSLRPRFLFPFAGFAIVIVVAGVFAAATRLAGVWPERRARLVPLLKGVAAAGMVAASLVILPRAYTLPKQDFVGAMEYVEAARGEDDVVAAVGLTILPYRDYFATDYVPVESVGELNRMVEGPGATFVLNTIPIFLESTAPALAARLADATEVARFRGSLGDGDVVVYRFEGAATSGGPRP